MAKKVTKILATPKLNSSSAVSVVTKRRTCGYARVSTDKEEQESSFENQMNHYTTYIKSREDLEFVGMYSDEGVTGTSMRHRDGFNQMIQDAMDGKIDLIITKSVSRFARNTVDSLTTIRKLKEKGVEVYFEEQNIYTFDSKGELLITIMSSLAQEEAHSISDNTKWGKRKQFADGKVSVAYSRFLGYDKGPDGGMVINPEQAETVKQIYKWYLDGLSAYAVAKKLTEMGIKTASGKDNWAASTVSSILRNEKYKGDALLQKCYTEDFMTKKRVKNDGSVVPQYYVEGNHEAIIDPDTFDAVQLEMQRRKSSKHRYSGVSFFSSKIKCGQCGAWYGRKVHHSNDKYRKIVYSCNRKFDGEEICSSPSLSEEQIKECFLSAVNKLISDKENIIENIQILLTELEDTADDEKRLEELTVEMETLDGMLRNHISENAHRVQDQAAYQKRYEELATKFEATKKESDGLEHALEQKNAQAGIVRQFISELKELDEPFRKFDERLWCSMVDFITVYAEDDIRVRFRYGAEVKV